MLSDREIGRIHSNPLFHSLAEGQHITCMKCGYRWLPRFKDMPKACPECKTRLHGMPRGILEIVPEEEYALFPHYVDWRQERNEHQQRICNHIDAAIHAFILLEYVRPGIPGPRPPPAPAPAIRTHPPVQPFGPARYSRT